MFMASLGSLHTVLRESLFLTCKEIGQLFYIDLLYRAFVLILFINIENLLISL